MHGLNIAGNGGNMKSWLVVIFKLPQQFDSQFFILRVIASVFIINQLIKKYDSQNQSKIKRRNIYNDVWKLV
jgi:hypothetical protein